MARRAAELLRRMWTVGPHEEVEPRVSAVFVDLRGSQVYSDNLTGQVARIEAQVFPFPGPFLVEGTGLVQFFLHPLRYVFGRQPGERDFIKARPIDPLVAGLAA